MRFASLLAVLLCCCAASHTVVHAADTAGAPAEKARPAQPPPGASIPVAGPQLRLAKNQLGQVIELRDIDDPANPYAGKYGDSDRWYFEHYVAAVTPEEEKHFGG